MDKKHIVFTGGGTLGHVMTNLYLIQELRQQFDISYIGGCGIEKEKVKTNVKYYEIPTIKLVRGKFLVNLKIPFVLFKAVSEAKKVLKKIRPAAIFSNGGYVSLPVCLAGKMLHIPIIAHESDYSFGLANKIILKLCTTMCVNFKHLEKQSNKIIYTGPVLSKNFESERKDFSGLNLDKDKHTILFVCGSLGSQKINDTLFACLNDLMTKYNILHITGKGNLKLKAFDNYNAFETVADMNNLYNIADFVVGRAGAGVTSECFFKSVPMLLIPLENKASRGDQLQNANYYKRLGVAEVVREAELSPSGLIDEINQFDAQLKKYQAAFKGNKPENGREKILDLLKSCLTE